MSTLKPRSKSEGSSRSSGASMGSQFNIKVFPKKRKQQKKKRQGEKKKAVSDLTLYPAYSKYQMPYYMVCQRRYHEAKKRYEEQFLFELKMQEAMQPSAYDAMRFHRHFVYTTLWPPLHTQKEIEYTLAMYELTGKQKKRLRELMTEKLY